MNWSWLLERQDLNDMLAFIAVAEERSFTKAAAKLGTSQSTLSHTIKQLEGRLGLRLLTRTTHEDDPQRVADRRRRTVAKGLRPSTS
jgi:DNA-binding transcriptional LysR family regulator